jgi:hypothetical protein
MAYSYTASGVLHTFAVAGWAGPRPTPMGPSRFYPAVNDAHVIVNAHQRLQHEGWRVGAVTQPELCACSVFWASHDGLLLRMSANIDPDRSMSVVVHAYHTEPSGVLAGAVTGLAVGMLAGWLVMAWLTQRFVRTPRRGQILIALFGLPALCACVVNTVDNVLSMVPDPDIRSVMLAADFMYPLANQLANPLAATVIGLAATAIMLVRVGAGRREDQATAITR